MIVITTRELGLACFRPNGLELVFVYFLITFTSAFCLPRDDAFKHSHHVYQNTVYLAICLRAHERRLLATAKSAMAVCKKSELSAAIWPSRRVETELLQETNAYANALDTLVDSMSLEVRPEYTPN